MTVQVFETYSDDYDCNDYEEGEMIRADGPCWWTLGRLGSERILIGRSESERRRTANAALRHLFWRWHGICYRE